MRRALSLLSGVMFLLMLGCAARDEDIGLQPAGGRSGFATVNGVKLNYLEWPGPKRDSKGTLVLIHGTGDSPHLFDDFAPRFQDSFRVIAYARRGHASSEAPAGPYDFDTLVEDLRQLLDRLKVGRANLLGYSLGGNEITMLASLYPDRVDRLVYLEAAYDWSDRALTALWPSVPVAAAATVASLASLDAYRKWQKDTWWPDQEWSPGLEAYIRDIARLDEDGRVHERMRGELFRALWDATMKYKRDYSKVRAPALALYAETYCTPKGVIPERATELAAWERKFEAIRKANSEQLQEQLPGAIIRRIPDTSHATILWSEAAVAEIRRFLLEGR